MNEILIQLKPSPFSLYILRGQEICPALDSVDSCKDFLKVIANKWNQMIKFYVDVTNAYERCRNYGCVLN
jgi:hypothetical protein